MVMSKFMGGMMLKANRVAMVLNDVNFFLSHRLPIALELNRIGCEVHIICPDPEPECFSRHGFVYHQFKLSRKGMNPFDEIGAIYSLYRAFKIIKPDLVHLVTIKPYLYGGVAARFAGVSALVSAVAGLGIIFSRDNFKTKLLRSVLFPLFKFAFGHKNQKVIFQNSDDKRVLVDWIKLPDEKTALIRGAGVDLKQYSYLPEFENKPPVIAFAARLLRDKGVAEFVEASKLLQHYGVTAKFWLIGEPDEGSSNSVSQSELSTWQEAGLVECFGYRSDIPDLFSRANIVTLPSYYGEGLPKVLIEAAACGRAVVTTDWPGCRDSITPNETGLLVPVKDAMALADALKYLIENPANRLAMGMAGRKLALESFDVNKVIEQHMKIYQSLLERHG